MEFQKVIEFWFSEIDKKAWWNKDEGFDQALRERFGKLHQAAIQCELWRWREQPLGRLAEIIVLDQFSRNMYRGRPESFQADALALALAQEGVRRGDDQTFERPEQKSFFYMPYMHSESLAIHEQAVLLFSSAGLEFNLDFEIKHKKIIDRFGRYPHRNQILGRSSTPEEMEFLKTPGSSF